ncbi:MAG: Trans-acting enoyl reductase [Luteibacter sp.]|uniref:saccharopine dehydrogenase NADP-binding domain-containing protein n=1 Tax=Luteibacter sp. TaxID=1886636 RepID=UPI00137E526D|nr:saccharopine dehydrogenase NADP-binding domain-containing protein [Luteibacter sp.]KAF1007471.1 MAG: Trans-acting enoyl reductase [Luteibacter sp.]
MTIDLAIVGAYGDVGRQAVRHWLRLRNGTSARLRLGGRDPDALRGLAAPLRDAGHAIETAVVDVFDRRSLDAFVADARVVLNCAGPSHRIRDRVAVATLRAGTDYVDAAGDDALAQALPAPQGDGRRVLLSAGMRPGLSGLLPRWLALDMPRPRRLTSHIGVLDRFTVAAAGDFLAAGSEGDSTTLAAWRDGLRQRTLRRLDDQQVPGFPGPVTLLPYLDREAERVARATGIREGDWYSAIEDGKVLSVFERAHTIPCNEAIAMLRLASAVDLVGRQPRVSITMQLDSDDDSRGVRVQAGGNGSLSGAFAAVASDAVARGATPVGIHHAADVLDPSATIACLRALHVFDAFVVVEGHPSRLWHAEEGAL